jgi:hypothetical protein
VVTGRAFTASIRPMAAAWLIFALCFAQQTDPAAIVASQDQASAQLAIQWLHSVDPRTQAWGAYLALRDRRVDLVSDLAALLIAYPANGDPLSLGDKDRHDAMLAVLDGLIQLPSQALVQDAVRIYPEFPVQSLLLMQSAWNIGAPFGSGAPLLMNIFKTDERTGAWLAAGNMLVQANHPPFASELLDSMTVHALVTVVTPGEGRMGRGIAGSCLGPAPGQPKSGWPQVGNYHFTACARPGQGVLVPGVDPVCYIRSVDAVYGPTSDSSCSGYPMRDLARQHYISTMLLAPVDTPPIKSEVEFQITWQSADAYRKELSDFIERQQGAFEETARKLGAPQARPKLAIEIWDQRPVKTPLPDIDGGPGVSFTHTR